MSIDGSIIPRSFKLSVFAPGIAIAEYVRHAYELGDYEIIPNIKLKINDEIEVRTFNLRHGDGHEYRVINPKDFGMIFEMHPTAKELMAYYGVPGPVV